MLKYIKNEVTKYSKDGKAYIVEVDIFRDEETGEIKVVPVKVTEKEIVKETVRFFIGENKTYRLDVDVFKNESGEIEVIANVYSRNGTDLLDMQGDEAFWDTETWDKVELSEEVELES